MTEDLLRVLVIEDNPGDARLLREALRGDEDARFEIVHADRLARGLECLRSEPVDVLLLDLGLPDSQGMVTFEAVQRQAPELPIVVLSGLDDRDVAIEAVQRGAQDYLVKGQLTPGLLARALRYAVERERSEQRILHLNSVLRAVRSVNQLINRERDRQRVVQGVCDELAAASDYVRAWIAVFGLPREPPLIVCSPTDAETFPTPCCLEDCMAAPNAMRTCTGDECSGCSLCALQTGLTAVVVRLAFGPRVFGALGVVMPTAMAEDPDQLALVAEVANDTAYGLHGLENESKRQQAETALRRSERKFRAIFDHAGDPIIIYDLGGQILEVNTVACERLGHSYHELLGMRFTQLCTPETAAGFAESVQRLRQRGHDFLEADFRKRNGMRMPVELSTSLIRYGERPAALTSVRDVTNRKRAEEAQRLAAVGQLAAGVAHEFNNVLAGMSARAQVARTLKTEEAWGQLGDSVVRLTARGAEIGRNLISFARPGEPQKTPLCLEDQVETALAVAGREIENAQIRVLRDYQSERRPVLADAGQIQQVLLNVILNACHAMPDGGTLAISTRFEATPDGAGDVVTEVTDTGGGIAPEHLPHVFEPFFTTKGSYGESQRPGAGLGLSVSRGLIAAHGGTIFLDNAPAAGATCTIRLAACDEAVAAVAPVEDCPPALAIPTHGEGRVLLAEDEEDIRVPMAMALSDSGFEVIEASALPEAMQAVARQRLRAVVSDLMMPGGDGRRILELTRHMLVPPAVIFMTGKSEENLVQKLMDGGASLVLRKPVDVAEVVHAVLRLTGSGG